MAGNKNKIFVPIYTMERNSFYLLLRVRMQIRGINNINGVGKDFFEPETYQNGKKVLSSLIKKDLVVEQEGNILIREGLEKALDRILDSPQCMNFQNALLHKKDEVLSFYYADGVYVGVLMDKKETIVVSSPEEEVLYNAFIKQLDDKSVSRAFRPEHWDNIWRGTDTSGENGGIQKPAREVRITHSGNKNQRENFNTILVADNKKIQIVRGADSLPLENFNRETVSVQEWFGVICQELKRLKAECQKKSGESGTASGKRGEAEEKSEYQKVTMIPGFPRSRIGFVFWSLTRIIKGFPQMIMGMVKKKSLALLLYPLWAMLLFFYNMFMTCYYNDTFMLNRKARLGDLSPYIMAGTLSTPSTLKGLNMNWGQINTSFLVWPLMMLLTLIGRQFILQFKKRKWSLFCDFIKIPESARDCLNKGYGKGKSMWIVLAAAWTIGFIIMNPITIFLSALLLLLLFVQGADNGAVRLAFLWECAGNRKKIDAGQRPEPDSRKYRIMLLHGSIGMAIYGLVSLLLWFAVDYNWWIRLIVTILMVLFALIQVYMPGAMSSRLRSRVTIFFLLFLVALCAVSIFGGNAGIVFADDGGWTESGRTLAGLLNNAGFSTILGISLLTIGLGLGLPLIGVAIASLIIGGGTFLVGLTNTEAGDYVRKSSRQYFFGPEEGENKTIFCTTTEFLNFISGFVNPAGLTGTALKVFQGGKLVGDIVSTVGDIAGTIDDSVAFYNGEIGIGEFSWDITGLGLDFYGIKGDFGIGQDSAVMDLFSGIYDSADEWMNLYNDALTRLQNDISSRRQAEPDVGNQHYQSRIDDIQNSLQRLDSGQLEPPAGTDPDAYRQVLNDTLTNEVKLFEDEWMNLHDCKNDALTNLQNDISSRRQVELDAENLRHQNRIDDIQNSLQCLDSGQLEPPAEMDPDDYRQVLNDTLTAEAELSEDNVKRIMERFANELEEGSKQISKDYYKKVGELFENLADQDAAVMDLVGEIYDSADEWINLYKFLKTNGFFDSNSE